MQACRKPFKSGVFFLFFFIFFPVLALSAEVRDCEEEGKEFACEQALVRFSKSASPEYIQQVFSKLDATPLQYFNQSRIYYVKFNRSTDTLDQVVDLRDENKVLMAVPNAKVTADSLPNDPYFSYLWGLRNTGQFSSNGTGADIGIDDVWDHITDSSSIVVAVIDTGVDYTHPDLANNMWVNTGEIPNNSIDDDDNGYVDDVYGYDFFNDDGDPFDDHYHGTHVAGTIGAVGNNSIGVVGVAQTASIMAVKFLGSDGWGYYSGAVSAIEYAVANGAKVLNNSWGGGSYDYALANAVAASNTAGTIFVAAAGNSGENTDYYPNYPSCISSSNVISVAATTYDDELAYFSNYGAYTVDLGAPGYYIMSTLPTDYYEGSDDYGYLSGTSMATPHVAGAAALLWAAYPNLSHLQIINLLYQGVTEKSYLNGVSVTGGMLNLANSLILGDPALNNAPVANAGSTQYAKVTQTVTLEGSAIDEDGNSMTYSWSFVPPSGSSASLSASTSLNPYFTADVEGTYYASLYASDWLSTSVASTVSIVITNDRVPPNVVIRATKSSESGDSIDSGSQVVLGDRVVLNGNESTDNSVSASESSALEYEWEFISRPSGSSSSITDADQVIAYFVPDLAGVYTIRLTVNDGQNENSGEVSFMAGDSSSIGANGGSDGGSGGCSIQTGSTMSFSSWLWMSGLLLILLFIKKLACKRDFSL